MYDWRMVLRDLTKLAGKSENPSGQQNLDSISPPQKDEAYQEHTIPDEEREDWMNKEEEKKVSSACWDLVYKHIFSDHRLSMALVNLCLAFFFLCKSSLILLRSPWNQTNPRSSCGQILLPYDRDQQSLLETGFDYISPSEIISFVRYGLVHCNSFAVFLQYLRQGMCCTQYRGLKSHTLLDHIHGCLARVTAILFDAVEQIGTWHDSSII